VLLEERIETTTAHSSLSALTLALFHWEGIYKKNLLNLPNLWINKK